MFWQKYNKFIVGLLIAVLFMLSAGVISAAPVSVSALVADYITFIFNSRQQHLPEGYTVLMFNNRTYVPARFVAEQLNATVTWNEITRTVHITAKPCPDCSELQKKILDLEKIKDELEEKIKKLEDEQKTIQPDHTYRNLPQAKSLRDMNVEVSVVVTDDDQNYTRIYVSVENKQSIPLQLLHTNASAVVGGREYRASSVPVQLLDVRWYHNINYEDKKDGYIILPTLPESEEDMLLELTILYNDASQEKINMEFAIKY